MNSAPPHSSLREAIPNRRQLALDLTLLAAMLAVGLYLRLANLTLVQHFQGDQGRDYVVVWDWIRAGRWPLLGPYRGVAGDFAIGPGYFYLIAPLMVLTGFHPVSGPATIACMNALMVVLAWRWVLLSTGSRLAALFVPFTILFSAVWTVTDRYNWNPNTLPLATMLMAALIFGLRRRPVPCLTGYVMLCALLPHLHTTTLLMIAVSLPIVLWVLLRERPDWARDRGHRRWAWIALAAVWLALLYTPPLIYEIGPRTNLKGYIARSIPPSPPPEGPPLARAHDALDRLGRWTMHHNWPNRWPVHYPRNVLMLASILAGAAAMLAWSVGHRRARRADGEWAVLYLLLQLGGMLYVAFQKGDNFEQYYANQILAIPVLLLGWLLGMLLSGMARQLGPAGRRRAAVVWASRLLAFAILVACGRWTVTQLPDAIGVHRGKVWYEFQFVRTQEIARAIINAARGRPYSFQYFGPGGVRDHFEYLLRYMGNGPRNDPGDGRRIRARDLGSALFILTQNEANAWRPWFESAATPATPSPLRIHDANIYEIPRSAMPLELRWVEVVERDGRIIIRWRERD
ncbi:MAG TPA: hypothetical protein PLG73_06865 [Candidatus Sumerlaeota bacterium]|nr:hypothetical protein [Candidatus Sumerlaeota bacterium]